MARKKRSKKVSTALNNSQEQANSRLPIQPQVLNIQEAPVKRKLRNRPVSSPICKIESVATQGSIQRYTRNSAGKAIMSCGGKRAKTATTAHTTVHDGRPNMHPEDQGMGGTETVSSKPDHMDQSLLTDSNKQQAAVLTLPFQLDALHIENMPVEPKLGKRRVSSRICSVVPTPSDRPVPKVQTIPSRASGRCGGKRKKTPDLSNEENHQRMHSDEQESLSSNSDPVDQSLLSDKNKQKAVVVTLPFLGDAFLVENVVLERKLRNRRVSSTICSVVTTPSDRPVPRVTRSSEVKSSNCGGKGRTTATSSASSVDIDRQHIRSVESGKGNENVNSNPDQVHQSILSNNSKQQAAVVTLPAQLDAFYIENVPVEPKLVKRRASSRICSVVPTPSDCPVPRATRSSALKRRSCDGERVTTTTSVSPIAEDRQRQHIISVEPGKGNENMSSSPDKLHQSQLLGDNNQQATVVALPLTTKVGNPRISSRTCSKVPMPSENAVQRMTNSSSVEPTSTSAIQAKTTGPSDKFVQAACLTTHSEERGNEILKINLDQVDQSLHQNDQAIVFAIRDKDLDSSGEACSVVSKPQEASCTAECSFEIRRGSQGDNQIQKNEQAIVFAIRDKDLDSIGEACSVVSKTQEASSTAECSSEIERGCKGDNQIQKNEQAIVFAIRDKDLDSIGEACSVVSKAGEATSTTECISEVHGNSQDSNNIRDSVLGISETYQSCSTPDFGSPSIFDQHWNFPELENCEADSKPLFDIYFEYDNPCETSKSWKDSVVELSETDSDVSDDAIRPKPAFVGKNSYDVKVRLEVTSNLPQLPETSAKYVLGLASSSSENGVTPLSPLNSSIPDSDSIVSKTCVIGEVQSIQPIIPGNLYIDSVISALPSHTASYSEEIKSEISLRSEAPVVPESGDDSVPNFVSIVKKEACMSKSQNSFSEHVLEHSVDSMNIHENMETGSNEEKATSIKAIASDTSAPSTSEMPDVYAQENEHHGWDNFGQIYVLEDSDANGTVIEETYLSHDKVEGEGRINGNLNYYKHYFVADQNPEPLEKPQLTGIPSSGNSVTLGSSSTFVAYPVFDSHPTRALAWTKSSSDATATIVSEIPAVSEVLHEVKAIDTVKEAPARMTQNRCATNIIFQKPESSYLNEPFAGPSWLIPLPDNRERSQLKGSDEHKRVPNVVLPELDREEMLTAGEEAPFNFLDVQTQAAMYNVIAGWTVKKSLGLLREDNPADADALRFFRAIHPRNTKF